MAKEYFQSYPDPVLHTGTILYGSAMLQHAMPKEGIKKGQLATYYKDGTSNKVSLISSGKCYENLSAGTSLKVYKNHSFYIGGTIIDDLSATLTITNIVDTNDSYDVITLGSAGTLTATTVYYNMTKANIQLAYNICFVNSEYSYNEDVNGSTVFLPVSICVEGTLDIYKIPNYWEKSLALLYAGIRTFPYDTTTVKSSEYLTEAEALTTYEPLKDYYVIAGKIVDTAGTPVLSNLINETTGTLTVYTDENDVVLSTGTFILPEASIIMYSIYFESDNTYFMSGVRSLDNTINFKLYEADGETAVTTGTFTFMILAPKV